jgi:hypothetical protein
VVVPGLMIWEGATARRAAQLAEDDEDEAELPTTFPVPPMDLVVPTPPRQLARATARRRAPELDADPDGDPDV